MLTILSHDNCHIVIFWVKSEILRLKANEFDIHESLEYQTNKISVVIYSVSNLQTHQTCIVLDKTYVNSNLILSYM